MNMVQLFQRNQFQLRGLLILILPCVFLWVGIGEPLKQLLIRSINDNSGQYVGVQNFVDYFSNSGLVGALLNSVFVSIVVMIASVGIAFLVAFGLVRSQLWGKLALQSLIQIPLFVPSIFPCLGLIYLLGGQGLISQYLVDFELYGPVGVILGGIIFTLPHAVLLLTTTLRGIDSRLYQAASSLGASSCSNLYQLH